MRYWLSLVVVLFLGLARVLAATPTDDPPSWSVPASKSLKKVTATPIDQEEPVFLNNLDCTLRDFRLVASTTMQTGCFIGSLLGMMDTDYSTIIWHGTDEALPLLPYSPHQVLVPWPGAEEMLTLDAVSTGGSYLSMYSYPSLAIKEQRDWTGQLTAKQFNRPPNIQFKDPAGNRLVINPQTLAFADNGSWLAAETLSGAFIRINLATLDIKAFAPAYAAAGNPALFHSQVAIDHSGRFVAINNEEYGQFKVYDLSSCSGVRPNLEPETCQAYDYRTFVSSQIKGLRSIRHVRFVNEGLLSFEVRSNTAANDGVYELAPRDHIGFLSDYLALGDSYTSGEGAFDYLSGTDTGDNSCHLSGWSYPVLLTHDLFSPASGHSVACSGAVIADIGSQSQAYRGQVRGGETYTQLETDQPALLSSVMTNYMPGYVAQQRFIGRALPRIITVSVGGNDIGFGDIIEQCVTPHLALHSSNDCFDTYEDRQEIKELIDRTGQHWTSLFKQLTRQVPGVTIYVIGYPDIASDQGSCGLNVHLSKNELAFSKNLISYLDETIRQSAAKAAANYIDISQALAGHRLCEANSVNIAVNGLTAGRDAGALGLKLFGKESYHPNALGYQLIEQAILEQTHNLTSGKIASPVPSDLLTGPKTGRPVVKRIPVPSLAPRLIKRGQVAAVKADHETGLKPNTTYMIRLDGSQGKSIGSGLTDSSGDLDAQITIPEGTAPGGHSIDVTGDNQDDESIDITQPIDVPVSDSDVDGDGLEDHSDFCPTVSNSGQDMDHDDIDDACDGSISTTSPGSSAGPTTGGSSLKPPILTVAAHLDSRSLARAQPHDRQGVHTAHVPSGRQLLMRASVYPRHLQSHTENISPLKWLEWGLSLWLLLMLLCLIFKYLRAYEVPSHYQLKTY